MGIQEREVQVMADVSLEKGQGEEVEMSVPRRGGCLNQEAWRSLREIRSGGRVQAGRGDERLHDGVWSGDEPRWM